MGIRPGAKLGQTAWAGGRSAGGHAPGPRRGRLRGEGADRWAGGGGRMRPVWGLVLEAQRAVLSKNRAFGNLGEWVGVSLGIALI